jgi:hypothetical protein
MPAVITDLNQLSTDLKVLADGSPTPLLNAIGNLLQKNVYMIGSGGPGTVGGDIHSVFTAAERPLQLPRRFPPCSRRSLRPRPSHPAFPR